MYYWFFKLFNNIKSEHEAKELARSELESLFGKVEPIYNFFEILKETPLSKFTSSNLRIQDYITHELPYGKIQGYWGTSDKITGLSKLVKRLSYTREIYLVGSSVKAPEYLTVEIFPEGVLGKNFHYFQTDNLFCFRFITHQYFIEKSEYISKLSRNENEVERNVEVLFSHLMKNIYRIPASSTLSIGKRLPDYFAIREEPSLYLTHYFHPYKGKFHPKMVRALLNYICPHCQGTVLDNFAGSGTLLVEASLLGLNSIGVEINPLSVLMSNVKCNSLRMDISELKREIDQYFEKIKEGIGRYKNREEKQLQFSKNSAINFDTIEKQSGELAPKIKNHINKNEVIIKVLIGKELLGGVGNKEIRDFLLLALSGTISDVARRTKEEFLDVFQERVNNLYLRLFLFQRLNATLKINLGSSKTYEGDARNISYIDSESIEGIVNSPPYSVALDYIKNDYPQLVLLGLTNSIERLKMNIMGNPRINYSKGLFQRIKEEPNPLIGSETAQRVVKYLLANGREQAGLRSLKFFLDMQRALKEMYRVMKRESRAGIVIGNNHFMVKNEYIEVPNDKVILEIAENIGFNREKWIGRELEKSSEGNIREETIIILKK